MSAFLTHLAMGALLGLALRLPMRFLPLAALLAGLPDLDHLPLFWEWTVPFLEVRGTFHNLFFTIGAPLAVWAVLRWRDAPADWQRMAMASPLLLTSHPLLDMLPLDPIGQTGWVELAYPFSTAHFELRYWAADAFSPSTYSTFTILLVGLAALAILGVFAMREPSRRGPAVALAAVWIVLFPALAVGGLIVPDRSAGNAAFAIEGAQVRLPEGRLLAAVRHLGGQDVGARDLKLELFSGNTSLMTVSPAPYLHAGGMWPVDRALAFDARNLTALSLKLSDNETGLVYAITSVTLARSHVDTILVIENGRVWNRGNLTVPGSALNATATLNGSVVAKALNDRPLQPDQSWALPTLANATGARWEIRAVDDGSFYARGSVIA